jgi:fumarylacetoacetase
MIDETHDAGRISWVESADGHQVFPIQNLPHGVFSPDGEPARGGVAIGEKIFDLSAALEVGLFSGAALEAAQSGERTFAQCVVGGGTGGEAGVAVPTRGLAGC